VGANFEGVLRAPDRGVPVVFSDVLRRAVAGLFFAFIMV
jgi:hypothetical protein